MQRSAEPPADQRIRSLDGLRFIAIGLVIFFHYYVRWTPPDSAENLYAFGARFADVFLFRHGHFGVNLFFMVSGFVITFTLFRCRTLSEFAVRRLARLWPPMLLCALITLVVVKAVGQHFDARALYLLPSLAFTDPAVFNKLFRSDQFRYMDGAYWSLFVEVRFYVLISVLYFASGARFPRALLVASSIVLSAYLAARALEIPDVTGLVRLLFIAEFLPWFLLGIGVYFIYSGKDVAHGRAIFGVGVVAIVAAAAINRDWTATGACAVFVALFVGALQSRRFGSLLSGRLPVLLGCASYSLYLLHQHAGVELTCFMTAGLSLQGDMSAMVPLVTATLLWALSVLIFLAFEVPMNKWILARYRASRERVRFSPARPRSPGKG